MSDEIQLVLFEPESGWRLPDLLPQIPQNEVIAVDTETRDPDLLSEGPGFLHGKGQIAGISVAWRVNDSVRTIYLPIGHGLGVNLPKEKVLRWLQEVVDNASCVVFANASYDIGWLSHVGISFRKPVRDVIVMAALCEEEHPNGYSLDAISLRYLDRRKDERLLEEAAQCYGIDPKKDLWKLPAHLVGPYAEMDARNTFDLAHVLIDEIEKQELETVFKLECELIPVLHRMSRRGIRVDLEGAARLNDAWIIKEREMQKRLHGLDVWSNDAVGTFLERLGLKVPRTKKGNFNVDKEFLGIEGPPELGMIRQLRALNRMRKTYVEDLILVPNARRIHCEFVQLHRDEGGTRTGRLAAKNPNLTQIPVREKELEAWRVRQLFLPEEGEQWAKADYSSQEPRLQVHYGLLMGFEGAEEAAEVFRRGEKLYTFIEKNAQISYDDSKMVLLARSYNMQPSSMSRKTGKTEDECEEILAAFDALCPYVGQLSETMKSMAANRGYIRTLLGRRRHFNWWEPMWWEDEFPAPVFSHEAALARWPNKRLRRSGTHKAFNACIQGGSADQTKTALVHLDAAGLPVLLPVHDEINMSVKEERQAKQMKEIMENAIRLRLPVRADLYLGPTWK